eukprot:Amastigsp_a339575_17.p4 type:complete len:112 gc:universal Amastigsp_a339575_17:389-724(+)
MRFPLTNCAHSRARGARPLADSRRRRSTCLTRCTCWGALTTSTRWSRLLCATSASIATFLSPPLRRTSVSSEVFSPRTSSALHVGSSAGAVSRAHTQPSSCVLPKTWRADS